MRLTAFATNTPHARIAALELRHRRRARAKDRIRAARATGLRNLPLHKAAQNKIWLEIVRISLDLLAWMPLLALTGPARLWEVKRLRQRLLSAAAQLVTTGRRRILRLAGHWPWTDVIIHAPNQLQALPNPGLTSSFPVPTSSTTHRNRGTRRPPDATTGPPCPPTETTTPNKPKGLVGKLTNPHARSWLRAGSETTHQRLIAQPWCRTQRVRHQGHAFSLGVHPPGFPAGTRTTRLR